MIENNKNNRIEDDVLLCPSCSGTGRQGLGTNCSNCGGIGMGMFYHNYFFYWQPQISFGRIELGRFRKKLHLILNFSVFSFGVVGILALFYWVYSVSAYSIRVDDFAFWRYQDPLLLIFWLSIFADLFVVYRMSQDLLQSQAIKVFAYKDSDYLSKPLNNWSELKDASTKEKIDVSKAMSLDAFAIVEEAFLLARRLKHPQLSPMHLFFASLANQEVSAVFSRLDIDKVALLEKLKKHLAKKETGTETTVLSSATKKVLIEAYFESSEWGQKKVKPKNLIATCLHYEKLLFEILNELGITEDKIKNVVLWFIINEKQVAAYKRFRGQAIFKPATTMDKAYTAVATPVLDNFAYDLTIAAKWSKLEYCVARDKEIEKIWDNLEGGANGVLLLGPDGVGKRTVMSGVAQRMVEENVPSFLLDKRLVEVDIARLVSGVDASQAEGRMTMIIDEVSRAGNIVLFVSNVENIIGITSGSEASVDLAEVLSSAIQKKSILVFASVSSSSYLKYLEGSSLDLTMAKVEIKEPKGNQAIQIIESKISSMEARHGVYFSYGAIEKSVVFSDKYMHDSYLPEKALKILETTAVKVSKKAEEFIIVSAENVAEIVSDITDIPLTKISEDEGKDLLNLEERIHERMVSQEEAVKTVASSIRRARTELREGVRPIANFLFLGPTGVGKTELAKTVTDVFFGDKKYMIRIDMSEYQHPDSIKKMIGDSSGTKGHLTEAVRKSPFSLILLDEIEKAHPEIMNIFLQVMDDGRLTDGQGNLIDFTNSIIIATSNAGANYIQEEIHKGTDIKTIRNVLINDHLNKVMRPELINRFDRVIVFEPLSLENVVDITRIMLKDVEHLLQAKGIELLVSEGGLRMLAKLGYDPKFGARPLRRLLQDRIEDKIANKILAGELKRRDTVIIDERATIIIEKGVEL